MKDKFFGHYWKIASAEDGNKVIETDNPNNLENGINIRRGKWNKGNNQKFLIIPAEPPEGDLAENYYIIAKYSGRAVAAQHDDSIELPLGINVWQWDFNETKDQQWNIKKLGEELGEENEETYIIYSRCCKKAMRCISVSNALWLPKDEYLKFAREIYAIDIGDPIISLASPIYAVKKLIIDSIQAGEIKPFHAIQKSIRDGKLISILNKAKSKNALYKVQLSDAELIKTISMRTYPKNAIHGDNIDLSACSDKNLTQKWKFEAAEDIRLAKIKSKGDTETDIMKKYLPHVDDINQDVPRETKKVLISEEYIPFIYVKDDQLNIERQAIESPYYIFRFEQYWKYSEDSANIVNGGSIELQYKTKSVTSEEFKDTMEKVLTVKFNLNAKGTIKGIDIGGGGEVSKQIKCISERLCKAQSEAEQSKKITYTEKDGRRNIYQYQLYDFFSIYRMHGNQVGRMVQWFEVPSPITELIEIKRN
jgi:hypothetical protein